VEESLLLVIACTMG